MPGQTGPSILKTSETNMKTALVVLGMHRSGTSSVAGALTLLGAAPPLTLMAPAADNPRGFWESNVVMALNDTLLAEAGATWSDWAPLVAPVAPDPRVAAVLDGEFGQMPIIVLKDPRMCRVFPVWRTALEQQGYRALVVSPIRHPSEVAASLMARNPISRQQGLRLWLRHVLDAEAASRGLPRHFMRWSSFMADWRAEVVRMNTQFGIALAPVSLDGGAEVDAFLSAELHHQRNDEPTSPLVSQTWDVLENMADHRETHDLLAQIDTLRSAFDQASDLFADAP